MADYGIAEIAGARILHHSEQDEVRRENQINRLRDNRILQELYMPHRKKWTANYLKHKLPIEGEAWSHGRKVIA
jgi:hypothetical protein